jgi:hypothetical protein
MYWWHIEPIKQQFASGGPSEPEKLKYLILTLALYVVFGELGYLAAEADPEAKVSLTDWVSSTAYLLATIVGIYYCYRRNAAGDGRQFVERFICVGWPVSIRFFTFILLGFVCIAVLGLYFAEDSFNAMMEMDSIWLLFTVFIGIIFYWYLGRHIYDTATQRA